MTPPTKLRRFGYMLVADPDYVLTLYPFPYRHTAPGRRRTPRPRLDQRYLHSESVRDDATVGILCMIARRPQCSCKLQRLINSARNYYRT